MDIHREHLRLLSLFHFIFGGIAAVFGSFPLLHVLMGAGITVGLFDDTDPAMRSAGPIFMIFGVVLVLAAWIFAALVLAAGHLIRRRRAYVFCLGVAGLECLALPFGTVLGVCTMVVLLRPGVKDLFADGSSSSDQALA